MTYDKLTETLLNELARSKIPAHECLTLLMEIMTSIVVDLCPDEILAWEGLKITEQGFRQLFAVAIAEKFK